MKNLVQAVLNVMEKVKGIEKNLTVGSGNNTYKGVGDKDVKKTIGKAMQEEGLVLLPIGIEEETRVDRWQEENQYGIKQKQSVFTKVKTKYLLVHSSGESQELMGYGQGVDSQDKGAGKATTYALKYTLLYTFLVPTGKIDDADNTHSDDIAGPVKEKYTKEMFETQKDALKSSKSSNEEIIKKIKAKYILSKEVEKMIIDL